MNYNGLLRITRKNYTTRFLSLFLIVLVSYSCHKPTLPNHGVDAGLKSAYSFNKGSYWLYKDSVSGRVDSFFVRSLVNDNFTDPTSSFTYDAVIVDIAEYNPASVSDSNEWRLELIQNTVEISYDVSAHYNEGLNYPVITFPFSNSTTSSNTNLFNGIITTTGNFSIEGNTYANVAKVDFMSNPTGQLHDIFYLNAEVGMIKMAFNHSNDSINRKWELQKSVIVK